MLSLLDILLLHWILQLQFVIARLKSKVPPTRNATFGSMNAYQRVPCRTTAIQMFISLTKTQELYHEVRIVQDNIETKIHSTNVEYLTPRCMSRIGYQSMKT